MPEGSAAEFLVMPGALAEFGADVARPELGDTGLSPGGEASEDGKWSGRGGQAACGVDHGELQSSVWGWGGWCGQRPGQRSVLVVQHEWGRDQGRSIAIDVDATQLWSIPNVEDVLISLSNFPINDVADGAECTIVLVLDLTGLASSETGFAIRPNAPGLGNLGPDRISFVSAEIACDP